MDYNSTAPLQRRRNIYMCNIRHTENEGYIARNNHSRNHPNVSPNYTIINDNGNQNEIAPNPNIHDDEYHLSNSDPIISNVGYDGDTYMENAPMDTYRFITYCCSQHFI